MTLRARLSLVILTVVLLPLVGGIAVVAGAVPDAMRSQTIARLDSSRAAVTAVLTERCAHAGSAARSLALAASTGTSPDPADAVREVVDGGQGDYAAVLDPSGSVLAEAGSLPPSALPAALSGSCSLGTGTGDSGAAPVLAENVEVTGRDDVGRAVVATRVDDPVAAALRSTLMVHGDLTLTAGGTVVATTLAGPDAEQVARAAARGAESVKDGDMLVSADQPATDRKAGEPPLTVVVTAEEPTSGWLAPGIATVVLTALALAGVLGWRIARDLTRPLAELTAGAERVARGDLAAQIPVRSRDEVGRMAVAFNDMTERVRAQLDELARGRDALQANLDRVGGALALTHDLDGILDVVLDTAMSAVDAGAGAVYVGVHGGPMRARATRGLADDRHPLPDEMTPGVGVLGTVASTGVPVRGVLGEPGLEPGPGEPSSGTVLAAPLRRSSLIVGVLAVFAGQHRPHLTEADQETIRTLAAQASVAVDNVLLHEEAQRLSITDPLTGLWNFRYLSMSLNRELDRGSRFDRQVAVLMLDLDHFKDVNDTYGHQRGDAVLHELSHRVAEQIREVDTFARYGGEEFALVLPETDEAGSALVAERVCAAVRATPFGGPGETPLAVTVSIGCALFPQHGGNPTTLLRAADRALYAAKRAGRDRWRIVTVDVTESRPDRLPDASDRAPDASDRASGGSPQPGPDDRPGGAIGPSAEYARERGELPPHR